MVVWRDTSSWSQGDTKKTKASPKTWSAQIGLFRLTVTRNIHYKPDEWVMNCRPPLFHERLAASKNIDEAKLQAVAILQSACEDVIREITT